ncbi:MAG: KH domain-containing protein [Chitinispirillaceae bacterium]|nr:KH domain-containing protein [Chitinispirillaceae bacterium]
MYFDPEELTDVNMRFIASEYIRKEIINNTREEVPHAVFVEIESYKELPDKDIIEATIHVETNGQKGIIIGKGGSLISKIRENAAAQISRISGKPVTLFCHVKVSPKWRDNSQFLKFVGFESH